MASDPTGKEFDAKMNVTRIEKRSELLARVKRGAVSKGLILTYVMCSLIMILGLWLASRQKGYILFGAIMASNAYVFAIITTSAALHQMNQRINGLVELIGEKKLLQGDE